MKNLLLYYIIYNIIIKSIPTFFPHIMNLLNVTKSHVTKSHVTKSRLASAVMPACMAGVICFGVVKVAFPESSINNV